MLFGNQASEGKKPTTPVIGTATDGGTGTSVSVAFTPSTYIGKGTITYTATSSPGSLTGTGSGSPITVSGLTTGTAYTFTVAGTTNYGVASDSSAASNSVTPASPSSFESIATITPTAGATSITFSSIPSTYKSLQLRWIAKSTATASGAYQLRFQLNGDTGANYASHYLYGSGSSAAAEGRSASTVIFNAPGNLATSNSSVSNIYSVGILDIIDYASTSKTKTIRHISGLNYNGATTGEIIALQSGLWNSTAATTSLTILNSDSLGFVSTSSFALYGIKG